MKFEIDDVEAEWTYNEDFDYIHSRFMAGSIGDWPKYIDQAYKYSSPYPPLSFPKHPTNLLK